MCWNKGRLCWQIAKLFYFCHLKKSLTGRKLLDPTLHFKHVKLLLWSEYEPTSVFRISACGRMYRQRFDVNSSFIVGMTRYVEVGWCPECGKQRFLATYLGTFLPDFRLHIQKTAVLTNSWENFRWHLLVYSYYFSKRRCLFFCPRLWFFSGSDRTVL